MQVLLCAATSFEIEATFQLLKNGELATDKTIDVLVTGVGLLPATYSIAKHIHAAKYDLVVQAGVGGCLDETIALGETVVIRQDCMGDAGVIESSGFKTLFDLNLIDSNEKPWSDGKLLNPYTNLLDASGLKIADGVTVNEISTNMDRISFYKNSLHVSIESLEGAALHYVALMEGIPFLQLRSVSNYIGERDKKNWLLKGAIENLNTALQRILINI